MKVKNDRRMNRICCGRILVPGGEILVLFSGNVRGGFFFGILALE